ncbi:hypothetical protein O181_130531 [Austropuccinia psidii MF-1]|uniref:Uncharacterized protein n=1 Tax=Austropuccinia psidii MF-1 TaxID=1389203 RepID=A0A9Q3L2Y7_9BASI|nr:hypothetical protein [Austropuccinia psidii MF-1]
MSQYKQYYTVYKDNDWEMLPQIHQGVMNSWNIFKTFLKDEEIVRYSNVWNPLSYKPQIKNIKDYNAKKKEVAKEEAPSQPTSPRREEVQEKELEKVIFSKLQDAMDNVFNIARNLMEFKDKEEQRMRQPHFSKK